MAQVAGVDRREPQTDQLSSAYDLAGHELRGRSCRTEQLVRPAVVPSSTQSPRRTRIESVLINRLKQSFSTSGNGRQLFGGAIISAPLLEEETDYGVFRWARCLDGRDARLRRRSRRHDRASG